MRHKLLTILVFIAVVFSMTASGTCAALSSRAGGKTPCKKSRTLHGGIVKTSTGACQVLPCQANKGRLFLLPDTSGRRIQFQKRAVDRLLDAPVAVPTVTAFGPFQTGRVVLRCPPAFIPPPLYYLHCSLIC